MADLKARLRPSAQISRQYYRGERWYVVRDPAGNQFHRLSAPAYQFVGLLDGTRTVAQAWELCGGQMADDAPTQNEVIQILSQLHSANLLEADVTPDAAVLLRRHKRMVKRQWQGRLMNVLFPRIPLWDPDRFICRWMPAVRPFLSLWGAILWLVVVGTAIAMLAPEWARLQAGAQNVLAPSNWPFLWASFVLIKAIHELGHGFACRRFEGEVHEMGIMFLVFVPAPYVDASTAWGFPNKWARIFVGAGGMIIELFVAALAAFVWLKVTPGTTLSGLLYNLMIIASVSTVLFNANPLLRYDGYYMLSDLLEIPNLRYRSTEYTMGLIKRHLFKVKSQQPLPPVGQRFWLFSYAIASTIYRTMIGVFIILMVWRTVPVLGVLMALGGVMTWLLVPVFKTLKYLLIDPELHRKRTRAALWTAGAVAAAVILLGFIPFKWHFETVGVVEPLDKRTVHAQVPGLAMEVPAQDGQLVKRGDVILVCKNPTLEAELAQYRARAAGVEAQLRAARAEDAPARTPQEDVRVQTLEEELRVLKESIAKVQSRVDLLTVRAPIDGYLIAPHLKEVPGRYVQAGEELFTVADVSKLTISALVAQTDAALVFFNKDEKVQVRLAGLKSGDFFKSVELTGTIEKRLSSYTQEAKPQLTHAAGGEVQIDPTDQKGQKLLMPQFSVWVDIDNPDGRYLPGQRANLRFLLGRESLYVQWSRRVWQLIQSHSDSKWI